MTLRIFLSALVLTLALLTSSAVWASDPLQTHCVNDPQPLEFWVDKYDTIVVGKAKKVLSSFEMRGRDDGFCWAKFILFEWIKGSGPNEIWISSRFAANATVEDIKNLKYCEFEKGHTYLIYGRHNPNPRVPPEKIGTASVKKSSPPVHRSCPPNTELTDENREALLNKVRALVDQQNIQTQEEGK